jgi:hypothetical protein
MGIELFKLLARKEKETKVFNYFLRLVNILWRMFIHQTKRQIFSHVGCLPHPYILIPKSKLTIYIYIYTWLIFSLDVNIVILFFFLKKIPINHYEYPEKLTSWSVEPLLTLKHMIKPDQEIRVMSKQSGLRVRLEMRCCTTFP